MGKCTWTGRDGKQHSCQFDLNGESALGGCCIMHSSDKLNRTNVFRDLLNRIANSNAYAAVQDYSGVVFPEVVESKHLFLREVKGSRRPVKGDVRFEGSTFQAGVSLGDVVFEREAHFGGAQFLKTANFWGAEFQGSAFFDGVLFAEEANFIDATFSAGAWFRQTEFRGPAYFDRCAFLVLGDFFGAVINGRVRFSWPGLGDKWKNQSQFARGTLRFDSLSFRSGSILDLTRNELADDTILQIHRCRMDNILLEGTDCYQIKFYDNIWPKHRGRAVVGDEWQAIQAWKRWGIRSSVRWDLIRATYQQLAKRFREDFDHLRANEFDQGQFEMRRLSVPVESALGKTAWRATDFRDFESKGPYRPRWAVPIRAVAYLAKRWLSLPAFYRYVSLYSGSVMLPVTWLVLSILGFGAYYNEAIYGKSFALAGKDGLTAALQVAGLNPRWIGELLRNPPLGISYSSGDKLSITLAATLQLVLTAVLVTLLVFSIRRRFKH